MTEDEKRTARMVIRWIELGYPDRMGKALPSDADIDHSALLARLLAGKEPLPVAPPRAYSYPWYSLIEDGEARLHSMDVYAASWRADKINICQSLWEVVDVKDGVYTLKYNDELPLFTLEPSTYTVTGYKKDGTVGPQEVPGWLLKKVEDA